MTVPTRIISVVLWDNVPTVGKPLHSDRRLFLTLLKNATHLCKPRAHGICFLPMLIRVISGPESDMSQRPGAMRYSRTGTRSVKWRHWCDLQMIS